MRVEVDSTPHDPGAMRTIGNQRELELTLEGGTVLIFKHSYTCSKSARAFAEVGDFAEEHPDVLVLLVDVLAQPGLSAFIEDRLRTPHATPQVILLEAGVVCWDASREHVTASRLEEALHP
jgi:bacillithiol system protein YtxJ